MFGADVNYREDGDEHGRTILSNAVVFRRVDLVRALLENGADPNAVQYDSAEKTLAYAARTGMPEAFEL